MGARGGPSVTVAGGGGSAPSMSRMPKRRTASGGSERTYGWIVASLLGASAALLMYDAYVLLRFAAGA
jgi:hypothetical protein